MFVLPQEGWRAVLSRGVGILVNYLHRERIPLFAFRPTSICFFSSWDQSQLYNSAPGPNSLFVVHTVPKE